MDNNFILKQTKEVTMTQGKTVTIFWESLESVDCFGQTSLKTARCSKTVDYHDTRADARGIA